jgi:hypothetical protein
MNSKKIILLIALTLVGILGTSQMALAATPTLSATPSSLNKNVGETFYIAVNLIPQGENVCVVKGTINFNNLTCKGITLNSGLMVQTTPTCANPKFVVGIPGCTNAAKNILTVSVAGTNYGQAKLSFTDVKVIGEGKDNASDLKEGTYNIASVQASQTVTPENQDDAQIAGDEQTSNIDQQVNGAEVIPTDVGAASLSSILDYKYFWPLLIIFIILCIGYGIYYFINKKKEKK